MQKVERGKRMNREQYCEELRRKGFEVQGDFALLETPHYGYWLERIEERTVNGKSAFGLRNIVIEYPHGKYDVENLKYIKDILKRRSMIPDAVYSDLNDILNDLITQHKRRAAFQTEQYEAKEDMER